MPSYLGELAALATSLCWTVSATFFTLASQRVGSMIVNRARLVVAALFLITTHWLILAKRGLGGDFPALSGNLIRMLTAAAALWGLTLLQGQARATVQRLTKERSALLPIVGGSFMGPFLGVWLSLASIQLSQIGVASTLMALPPVFLLPVARFYFHEHIGWRAVAGTLVAVAGVVLLFLV